jgi:alginate O-acetyltransferase complex protein AlgI
MLLAAAELAKPILFVEFRFVWIFAIIFAVHWALRANTARKVWLLIASHAFYSCFFIGDPFVFFPNLFAGAWDRLPVGWWFPALLWFSTIMDYIVGVGIEGAKNERGRRLWVLVSIFINLGVLAFFKYYGFFEENVRMVIAWLGLTPSWEPLNIFLPYGISFYTFQSLSYSIEVYRRHLPAERSFLNLAFFIAFFPQVVAGPIVRAMSFLPQARERKYWANVDVRGCLTLFFIGFVKKACVGDTLAGVVDPYFAAPQDYNAFSAWMAVLCYAGQIYCDFSGYSDMAIAVARLLGYELVLNFNFPYFAKNITDFWRRWHISLSSWLRDYLYISLGGNRGSRLFTYRNLMLTMLLGGLWHGASWAFIVWGGLHGIALIFHREWTQRANPALLSGVKWMAIPLTFYWVLITWVPFRASDVYVEAGTNRPLRALSDGFYEKEGDRLIHKRADLVRDPLTGHWRKKPSASGAAPPSQVVRGADESAKGTAEASVRGVSQDVKATEREEPIVVKRLVGSFGATGMIWRSLVLFHDHAKRSVVGNAMLIALAVLALVHWLNYRRLLSTWWRRIPDYLYAALLGAGVALALFMKPVVYKQFIYFQF